MATPTTSPAIDQLRRRLREISHLESAASLMHWDQTTYMPVAGAGERGEQIATLQRLAHERLIDPDLGELLQALEPHESTLDADSNEARLIAVARRDHQRARRVPAELTAEMHRHFAATYDAWTRARPANEFATMRPHLERTVELSRQYADLFEHEHVADPLIEESDPGMSAETVRSVFADLRRELVPLVREIAARPQVDDACVRGHFDRDKQLAFGAEVIRKLGFDFDRGRQDLTHHPFMTRFSLGDIRITTRVREDYLLDALFSTIHEAGHALYELGIDRELEGTPLASGTSSGVHESQSRLWENIVGRGLAFWRCNFDALVATFPQELGGVRLEQFHRAVNKVEPSLIRTDADEVTYNLHVMLRFDLELALLEGDLAVADLPAAWNERMQTDFGMTPDADGSGVLQDVHWYAGFVGGAFQGYTLGNLMSAQFYDAALAAHPDIPMRIEAGDFAPLHDWLRDNIYQHGRKFTASELLERTTGGGLSVTPFMNYLRGRFGSIYGLT